MGVGMPRRLYVLGFMLIAYVLFAVFGNNKREEKNVPVGMKLLTKPPILRNVLYAGGCMMLIFAAVIIAAAVLYDAELAAVVVAGLIFSGVGGLFFLSGRYCYASHIFFGAERIVIGRLFDKPDILTWDEIGKAEIQKKRIKLWDKRGNKKIDAYADMVGFEEFQNLVRNKCEDLL